MGGSESKESKPLWQPPPPREGAIKIDIANLKKIEVKSLNVPKPPLIKTGADLRREAKAKEAEGLEDFDLGKEFDQDTYSGRF